MKDYKARNENFRKSYAKGTIKPKKDDIEIISIEDNKEKKNNGKQILTIIAAIILLTLIVNFVRNINNNESISSYNMLIAFEDATNANIEIPNIPNVNFGKDGTLLFLSNFINSLTGIVNMLIFLVNGAMQVIIILINIIKVIIGN